MLKDFKKIQNAVKFKEAYLRPFATEIKKVIDIPLILPGDLGLLWLWRMCSKKVMPILSACAAP